jgi:signal recognition particle GTPase
MAEFKPIETQEDFDKAIKSRIERAEKAVREQFSDYEQVKESASKADEKIKELTAELEKKQVTIDGNKAIVDELNAKIAAQELSSMKVSVALEKGLPYQMAERLTGANKEEISADADSMVKLIGSSKKAPPMAHDDPAGGAKTNPTASAYKSLLGNLRQGD